MFFFFFPLTTRILILKKDAKSLDNCYLEKLSGFCGRAGPEGSLTHVYSPLSPPTPHPRQGMQAAVILERGAAEDGLESESLPLPSGCHGPVRGRVWSQGANAGALRVKRKWVGSL